jgi:hypothetical protein
MTPREVYQSREHGMGLFFITRRTNGMGRAGFAVHGLVSAQRGQITSDLGFRSNAGKI